MMKLYVMRHGETDWNLQVRLQGTADIPLNEYGRQLARETAKGLDGVHFDLAYSSPLQRAYETAQIVVGRRNIPILKDERIQEISFGDYEGKICKGPESEIPQELMDHFFHDTENYIVPSGGESFSEVLERTNSFYQDILHNPEYADASILISTHGATGRAILQSILDDGEFWRGSVPKNCAISMIAIDQGKVVDVDLDRIYYEVDQNRRSSFNGLFDKKEDGKNENQ